MDKIQQVFFELIRAGLWEEDIRLSPYGDVNLMEIYQLAEEQSVMGLITAGLEHVTDVRVPQVVLLQFIGATLQIEDCNKSMNAFISELMRKLNDAGIRALLVKGQGIAQCYERPLWRSSGDIDLLLDVDNYEKAKALLVPMADEVEKEGIYGKHLGLSIGHWLVELHGAQRMGLIPFRDRVLDKLQEDTFNHKKKRVWINDGVNVELPNIDNDIIYVFIHYLKHFYKGGIGIRQVCDWSRLIWSYSSVIDTVKLKNRLRQLKLLTEWKSFAAYSVYYLGMPFDTMPLFEEKNKWRKKAKRINDFILLSGNYGQNRDWSYFSRYPYLLRKIISLIKRTGDIFRHALIFPIGSMRLLPGILAGGIRAALRGE